jgi:hypothetical protein
MRTASASRPTVSPPNAPRPPCGRSLMLSTVKGEAPAFQISLKRMTGPILLSRSVLPRSLGRQKRLQEHPTKGPVHQTELLGSLS